MYSFPKLGSSTSHRVLSGMDIPMLYFMVGSRSLENVFAVSNSISNLYKPPDSKCLPRTFIVFSSVFKIFEKKPPVSSVFVTISVSSYSNENTSIPSFVVNSPSKRCKSPLYAETPYVTSRIVMRLSESIRANRICLLGLSTSSYRDEDTSRETCLSSSHTGGSNSYPTP